MARGLAGAGRTSQGIDRYRFQHGVASSEWTPGWRPTATDNKLVRDPLTVERPTAELLHGIAQSCCPQLLLSRELASRHMLPKLCQLLVGRHFALAKSVRAFGCEQCQVLATSGVKHQLESVWPDRFQLNLTRVLCLSAWPCVYLRLRGRDGVYADGWAGACGHARACVEHAWEFASVLGHARTALGARRAQAVTIENRAELRRVQGGCRRVPLEIRWG